MPYPVLTEWPHLLHGHLDRGNCMACEPQDEARAVLGRSPALNMKPSEHRHHRRSRSASGSWCHVGRTGRHMTQQARYSVLRSCQSPIWIWLVKYLHLHLHLQQLRGSHHGEGELHAPTRRSRTLLRRNGWPNRRGPACGMTHVYTGLDSAALGLTVVTRICTMQRCLRC